MNSEFSLRRSVTGPTCLWIQKHSNPEDVVSEKGIDIQETAFQTAQSMELARKGDDRDVIATGDESVSFCSSTLAIIAKLPHQGFHRGNHLVVFVVVKNMLCESANARPLI